MKLLLLTSSLPWPLEFHGGAQRTSLLLEALRLYAEVDVAFVSWSEESVRRAEIARDNGEKIVQTFFVPDSGGVPAGLLANIPIVGRPVRAVRQHLARYQVDRHFAAWLKATLRDAGYAGVVSRYLWPGAVGGLFQMKAVPTLLDWDDLDHLKLSSQIDANPWSGIGGWAARSLVLRRLRHLCLTQSASYDHVWVAKPSDVAGIATKSISVLPNIPFMDHEAAESRRSFGRQNVLFVGNLAYLPNSDALTKFLERIWPRILASCPNARLLAVGPPPVAEVSARWESIEGVNVVGTVPSLVPFYQDAAISICPVEWGGGSNIKAIESLGYGVPCVVSPYTFNAFSEDFDRTTGMICARSEEEYVAACVDLLTNPQRGADIGQAGRSVVQARYSRTQFQNLVKAGLTGAGVLSESR